MTPTLRARIQKRAIKRTIEEATMKCLICGSSTHGGFIGRYQPLDPEKKPIAYKICPACPWPGSSAEANRRIQEAIEGSEK